jgi:hypothetical protein
MKVIKYFQFLSVIIFVKVLWDLIGIIICKYYSNESILFPLYLFIGIIIFYFLPMCLVRLAPDSKISYNTVLVIIVITTIADFIFLFYGLYHYLFFLSTFMFYKLIKSEFVIKRIFDEEKFKLLASGGMIPLFKNSIDEIFTILPGMKTYVYEKSKFNPFSIFLGIEQEGIKTDLFRIDYYLADSKSHFFSGTFPAKHYYIDYLPNKLWIHGFMPNRPNVVNLKYKIIDYALDIKFEKSLKTIFTFEQSKDKEFLIQNIVYNYFKKKEKIKRYVVINQILQSMELSEKVLLVNEYSYHRDEFFRNMQVELSEKVLKINEYSYHRDEFIRNMQDLLSYKDARFATQISQGELNEICNRIKLLEENSKKHELFMTEMSIARIDS